MEKNPVPKQFEPFVFTGSMKFTPFLLDYLPKLLKEIGQPVRAREITEIINYKIHHHEQPCQTIKLFPPYLYARLYGDVNCRELVQRLKMLRDMGKVTFYPHTHATSHKVNHAGGFWGIKK